jgi:signal transduction histidine kinase/CheY-like chemotaxis protein
MWKLENGRAIYARIQSCSWLLVACCYLGLVLLRRGVFVSHIGLSPILAVWPATGIVAAGLLTMQPRDRRLCLAASVLGCFLIIPVTGFTVRPLYSLLEAWLVAYLVRALCGPKPNFSELRKLALFLFGAAIPAAAASGLLLYATSFTPLMRYDTGQGIDVRRVIDWFVGHSLGTAIFVPALVILADGRRFLSLRRPAWELTAALAAVGAVTGLLFFGQRPASWILIFPALMMLAFRYGPQGASGGALIISALGILRIYFFGSPDVLQIGGMQLFLVLVFVTTLPAAGAVASFARTRSLLAARTQTARKASHAADGAAAAKSEFLANMSHEIRTPLNGVIGLADALSRTDLTVQQRDMLRMILSSGKALTGLLSDALDLARAESGSLGLAPEPFDVREVVSEAAYLFETLAREKGLAFEVKFDPDPPGAAIGDPLRIKQIVSNLISNAVKFTAEGSVTVTVSMRTTGEDRAMLAVMVRDTGPGFDETVQARLFSRFEQGDSSVTRRYGGTGLGLAIAQRLANMMGGRIDCDALPGRGALFVLQIPVERAVASGAADNPTEEASIGGRGLTVLLAEDNLVNQKVVQVMLADLADLTVTPNGQAAVEAVAERAFDVILMDTHMPVMDGLTAIREIRRIESEAGRARTPIISLTADAMPQQVAAAIAAGADLHVAKPITAEGLIGALRTALHAGDDARAARA